jgi:hypothetical protein
MLDALYQNPFYTFIKTLHEIKEKFPQNNTKCSKKKVHSLTKSGPLKCVFTIKY